MMDTAIDTAGGDGPPFRFEGVRSRVFPLRASDRALQRLCDTYLNLFPDVVCFRPAAPYVLLALLHYGRMSYAPRTAMHRGWASQNEACFGVPLEWGRVENGAWRTHGSAVVTPFLFVDQPWSLEQGRDVYGWPKQPGDLGQPVPWAIRNPADREHLVSLAVESFARPYAGEPPRRFSIVDIDCAPSLGSSAALWQAPLGLDNPWWGGVTLWREAMRMWSSAIGRDARDLPMIHASQLWLGGASRAFCTVNLKQVRSLEDPTIASYQAVTMAPMRMTALHRSGLLGEGRIALSDPSGGYRVRVHRHPLWPIVETLGLVVSDEERRTDRNGDSADVVTLAPLFPYWLEADYEYGRGTTALWRSPHVRDGTWHRRTDDPGSPAWLASASRGSPARFDPTWGARALPAPPYHYPELVMRVLALPASRGLASVVTAWEPPPEVGRFRLVTPERPHVLVMVSTCREITAHVNSVGSWWSRQLSFLVPVIWTRDGADVVALVSAITFADGQLAATIARDIGPEAIAADLQAPPDAWLDEAGPRAARKLLWLTTHALDASDVGAEAVQRLLLEVLARGEPVAEAAAALPVIPDEDLPLCILGHRRVSDATAPEAVAYDEWFTQNLVSRRGARDWQRSAAALELHIHQYPDRLDLVGRLGLDVERREYGERARGTRGGIVHVIPTGLAWATLDITHDSNTSLAVRSHGGAWTAPVRSPGVTPRGPQADDRLARALVALGTSVLACGHG